MPYSLYVHVRSSIYMQEVNHFPVPYIYYAQYP